MKTKATIPIILCILCHWSAGAQSLQQLQMENRMLRARIDTLEKMLSRKETLSSDIFCTWDNLIDDFTHDEAIQSFDKAVVEQTDRILEKIDFRLRISRNETLDKYIALYSERLKKRMEAVSRRYAGYEKEFLRVFRQYGVPDELAALAIVESGMNHLAVSKAGAAGMWQLMPATARSYGLDVDEVNDERYDVSKSTVVAAKYLSKAFNTFGDWRLAVCSYNCGPGNVEKAISRAGGKTDFWEIYQYLPDETKAYLPSLIGVLYYLKTEHQ